MCLGSAMRCGWELSDSWVVHQPALSIPVKEHRAVEVLHTAPTSHHKPLKPLWFPPMSFILLEKETLKAKSLVKEGLRLGCPIARLLCASFV